ncbi:hypothetical protein BJ166DRAFT_515915 [Pestalotiopsis sp. NC0098]|nr:hypothetical protein BJ166DRAFT_515915 [Pestalotiopsis sp. NC0098]
MTLQHPVSMQCNVLTSRTHAVGSKCVAYLSLSCHYSVCIWAVAFVFFSSPSLLFHLQHITALAASAIDLIEKLDHLSCREKKRPDQFGQNHTQPQSEHERLSGPESGCMSFSPRWVWWHRQTVGLFVSPTTSYTILHALPLLPPCHQRPPTYPTRARHSCRGGSA